MQAAGVRRGPAVWCCRRLLEKSGIGWNRPSLRPVVEGVRKLRAAAAVLVASCVVVSGCTSSGEEEAATASEPVVEPPSNPWDLPLEQRPPLFDPCDEVSTEVVEEGVGAPTKLNEDLAVYDPPGLISCAWSNDELLISVLATWKSFDDYLDDSNFAVSSRGFQVYGRERMRLTQPEQSMQQTCHSLFFTGEGTLMISLSLLSSLNEFRGERFLEGCAVLDQIEGSIVDVLPEGDFR